MKTISKIILALAAAFASISCGNTDPGPDVAEKIVAEWHLVSVSGLSSVPQVYVDFAADGAFELYQKVGEGRYRKYDGAYEVAGSVLSGKYSDGEKWGSGYTAAFDGDYMTLTADNGSGEVWKYEKASLDQSEKDKADVVTKSEDTVERFL